MTDEVTRLERERDAYANALTMSNNAFMEKVKEFSIIKRIAESISWSLDKKQICTGIVDLIIDETTAENCSLWLTESGGKFIHLVAVRGQDNLDPRFFADPEKSTSQSAATLSRPLTEALRISLAPLPPAPMAARFSWSLGAV